MADKSGIEWTDATWNPTTGCDRVSPGCANCYALTLAPRLQAMAVGRGAGPTEPYMLDGDPKTSGPGFGLMMHPAKLDQPLRWTRPRRIFVNSMSDLFHPDVTVGFIDKVFAVMALAPKHVFQILTKRPDRMREYMTAIRGPYYVAAYVEQQARMRDPGFLMGDNWPLPNVWLGTSVENARWRTRIDDLRETPAAVRFLSCEPLLGPLVCPTCGGAGWDVGVRTDMECCGNVTADGECRAHCVVPVQVPEQVACPGPDVHGCIGDINLNGINWVIVGGESGPGARPMDEGWVRNIIASAIAQDSAPFVKQMGDTWSREHLGHGGHGGEIETFPADLRVREYPTEVTW